MLAASPPSSTRIPLRALLALALVGFALRAAFASAAGAWMPFGEDAEYWGYRAIELRGGYPNGSHPPVYPLFAMLIGLLPGLDAAAASAIGAWIAGVAMAPAMALGVAALADPRAGMLAGVLTLLLPNLLAWSVRVEPSGLFVCLLGLALVLVARIVRERDVRAAAALGALVVALGLTKENGQYYLVPGALPAILAAPDRRRELTKAFVLGVAVPCGAYAGMELLFTVTYGVGEKARVPFYDMVELIRSGQVPAPLRAGDDPVLQLSPDVLAGLSAEGTTAGERAVWAAGRQGLRLVRFLGLWLPLVPLAAWAVVRRWRAGRLEPWLAALLLLSQAMLGIAVVVFVQARHAEVALLGTIWALSIVGAGWWEAGGGRRAALVGGLGLLAAQQAFLLVTLEVPRARKVIALNQDMRDAARWAASHLPEGVALASRNHWVGFYHDTLTFHRYLSMSPDATWLLAVEEPGVSLQAVSDPLREVVPVRALDTPVLGRVVLMETQVETPATSSRVPLDEVRDGVVVTRGEANLGERERGPDPAGTVAEIATPKPAAEQEDGPRGPPPAEIPEDGPVNPHPSDVEEPERGAARPPRGDRGKPRTRLR